MKTLQFFQLFLNNFLNGLRLAETKELFVRYKIHHHRSSPYRPQANGAVEATNKNVKKIVAKMVETYRDWSEKLSFAIWGYRTTDRSSTGSTPYSLVYGMEAVLPIEIEIQSLRVLLEAKIFEYQWAEAPYDQLSLIDEKRMKALYHLQVRYYFHRYYLFLCLFSFIFASIFIFIF